MAKSWTELRQNFHISINSLKAKKITILNRRGLFSCIRQIHENNKSFSKKNPKKINLSTVGFCIAPEFLFVTFVDVIKKNFTSAVAVAETQ